MRAAARSWCSPRAPRAMYYGGTIIGLELAIIVMTQWYQLTGHALARTARRSNDQAGHGVPAEDLEHCFEVRG